MLTPTTMRLTRTRFRGDPAYLWLAPNGVPFYLQRTLDGRGWSWWRTPEDNAGSRVMPTLDALKAHICAAFQDD